MIQRAWPTLGLGLLLLILIPTSSLFGDWIQLHNGVQVHGQILRQDEDEVTLELTRGGVSSFDMRLVKRLHRAEPETRNKLPLGEEAKEKKELPDGLFPRPDAVRSVRRTVPGGTLLLPESALSEPLPKTEFPAGNEGAGATDAPTVGEHPSPDVNAEILAAPPAPRWSGIPYLDAIYRIDRLEIFVRLGREIAEAADEDQTDHLRAVLAERGTDKLHALELHRTLGLTTWVAERTTGPQDARIRQVIGWVRLDEATVEVIEVEIPEKLFLHDPYRYRVIPRSFRPGTQGTAPTDPPIDSPH